VVWGARYLYIKRNVGKVWGARHTSVRVIYRKKYGIKNVQIQLYAIFVLQQNKNHLVLTP
jgi:hypothetical protein